MKKVVLALLTVALIPGSIRADSNSEQITLTSRAAALEKNNITIAYGPFQGLAIIGLGSPYILRITNFSDQTVTIQPSVVGNELVSLNEAIAKVKSQAKILTRVMVLLESSMGALIADTLRRQPRFTSKTMHALPPALTLGGTALVSYGTYRLLSALFSSTEKTLDTMMLKETIALKSKETVQKIF